MCYGIDSSDATRVAAKIFFRRKDGRLITPGIGRADQVPISMNRWTLAPTPHGWHVTKSLDGCNEVKRNSIPAFMLERCATRIVWVAARAALCGKGWALIYVPSDPLAGPPPAPPLNSVPTYWKKVRRYGSWQKEVAVEVIERGSCRINLPKHSLYRMSRLDSLKRILNDFGWRLKYERYPCMALVTS